MSAIAARGEFSFRTRAESLRRFKEEVFDLLIIGGGITGAAVARDAVSRGLRVALVEKKDFAWGTSSRSSKLIHGGLRYLQNFEFGLVFEALSERAFLLKTMPHMVKPLKFFLPVYVGDAHGRFVLSLGLWLYDLLALLRTPYFHRRLSRQKLLAEVPALSPKGLKGGFEYADATMWDDVMTVETLRSASLAGVAIANYTEALKPIWEGARVQGYVVRDLEDPEASEIALRARQVVVCAGPWTDVVGAKLATDWKTWLQPSRGIHLLFDLKRLPVPGAFLMTHPTDGRVSFVIPRPDMGQGVVIVGTTDGPTDRDPEKAEISPEEVRYLMDLVQRYFPELKLTTSDILSAYVGVRPLMQPGGPGGSSEGADASMLQKVSREHFIHEVEGGVIAVAGGKYTTHRRMAQEIVDETLKAWRKNAKEGRAPALPAHIGRADTRKPVNPLATPEAIEGALSQAKSAGIDLPGTLVERYGAEALDVWEASGGRNHAGDDPQGFPRLEAQLRFAIRNGMALHLEDFYLRRVPLYSTRKDHGMPWAQLLGQVWAEERGLPKHEAQGEVERLQREFAQRSAWVQRLSV